MTVPTRNGVFWWLYVLLLAAAAALIAHAFVGILVLGLFGYYMVRPIRTHFRSVVESASLAAALTVATVLVPVLLLLFYASVRLFQQLRGLLGEDVISVFTSRIEGLDSSPQAGPTTPESLLGEPSSDAVVDLLSGSTVQQVLEILNMVSGTLLLIALAVTLSYALLVYDTTISEVFGELAGGPETTVYAYARAVDSDLESVFFGNFLFVLVMSVVATVTYGLTNLVAPPGLQIPMVITLGVMTGIASLLPIVVGKIVYLPIVAYLALAASQQEDGGFLFVGGVLVVYVLVLDLLPQSLLQPYISGRQINPMLLLFAYILGPIMFGWYGFFLLPIVFVLMLETVRLVLPELLHGDPIVPEPKLAEDAGAGTEEMREKQSEEQNMEQSEESSEETNEETSKGSADPDEGAR